jgi:stage IV sporulation protein FA
MYYRYGETGSGWSRFATGFALRLVLAAVIFSAAWIWFRSDLPYSREARAWTAQVVTQDMDFQAVQAWYEQTFGGSPSFLPMFRSQNEAREVFGGWKRSDAVLPVQGRVVQSYEQDGTGVRIAAPGDSRVKAVYGGRVMQVETDAEGKATVLIQHAGKIVTIYGNLQYPEVRAGDWVEAGDVLGSIPPPQDARGESLLYFAVRQNGKTVDPAEVVPFD